MPVSVTTSGNPALSNPELDIPETLGTTLAGETLEEDFHADKLFWDASTLAFDPTVANGNLCNTSKPALKNLDNRALRRLKRTIRSRTSSLELKISTNPISPPRKLIKGIAKDTSSTIISGKSLPSPNTIANK